jgi:hypothetical protein
MSRRLIGQESFRFGGRRRGCSTLDDLGGVIDWAPVDHMLAGISSASNGASAWPSLALLKAMLLDVAPSFYPVFSSFPAVVLPFRAGESAGACAEPLA